MRAPVQTIYSARRLRRTLSPPEALLWTKLRTRDVGRPVFRRQHPIGSYILDFYCAKARLAIEIDGASHGVSNRPERDERRDAWLKNQGVMVMRISAMDVMRQADEVADGIVRLAHSLLVTDASTSAKEADKGQLNSP